MASLPDDFDDSNDGEQRAPLLPPDDRLWRHPSEITGSSALPLDPVAVRSRWLASPPSRASAWTAGFVGALLATGLVVVGTHLASVLATPPVSDRTAATSTTVLTPQASPDLGAVLASAVARVGQSLAVIDSATASGTSEGRCLGIVIASDGTVLTAAVAVAHAASVLVYLPGDPVASVGRVVGMDATSGLAVVKVRGERGIPVSHFATSPLVAPSFALAVTSPGGARHSPDVSLGALRQLDVAATTATGSLVDADMTDLSAVVSPPGSPLLDADGNVEAIITGEDGGITVAAPGWLAEPVASELEAEGDIDHGWIGISGVDETSGPTTPAGVRVLGVIANSAAAKAGLRTGDVILSVNGERVTSMNDLQGHLYVLRPGTPVVLRYARASTRRSTRLVLASSTS